MEVVWPFREFSWLCGMRLTMQLNYFPGAGETLDTHGYRPWFPAMPFSSFKVSVPYQYKISCLEKL